MIEAMDLNKEYTDGQAALRDINFYVNRGEFVFLVGPSGAGKSTVFKLLMRELVPTSGTLKVFGKDVASLRDRQVSVLRRNLGVVFQDFRLLDDRTVYNNIEFAMRAGGASIKEIKKGIPYILKMVGLQDRAKSKVRELSGGEQQRVGIARAVSNRPSMILADEPTGNLDPDTSIEIINLLRDVNRKGTTVLVATHDKQVVDYFQQRVIYLENGELVGDESKGAYVRAL